MVLVINVVDQEVWEVKLGLHQEEHIQIELLEMVQVFQEEVVLVVLCWNLMKQVDNKMFEVK
jgi:hypothetical protein